MDSLQLFKEKAINNYLSSVSLVDIDVAQMKQDLKSLLGEEPAIRLNYVSTQPINEDGSKAKRIEKLDSISITFTINKEIIPGNEIPFPVTKDFLVD